MDVVVVFFFTNDENNGGGSGDGTDDSAKSSEVKSDLRTFRLYVNFMYQAWHSIPTHLFLHVCPIHYGGCRYLKVDVIVSVTNSTVNWKRAFWIIILTRLQFILNSNVSQFILFTLFVYLQILLIKRLNFLRATSLQWMKWAWVKYFILRNGLLSAHTNHSKEYGFCFCFRFF